MTSFNKVCIDVTKTARKIPQSDYLVSGKYKIFDQGKDYIGGYTDDNAGIVEDYPYIVFGDHTRIIKFVDEPCFIGADGVKLLKVYNSQFLPKYVYYSLVANPIVSIGYSRHFKYLKEQSIKECSIDEQKSIIAELENNEKAISIKKELLSSLDELVKSRFIEMFGNYFEDKSRLVKISSLATSSIGLTYKPENVSEEGTIVLRSGNIQNAELYLEKDIVRVSNVKIKDDKYVRENDILMCSRNGSAKLVGKCCRIPKLEEPMTYGAFMTVIRSDYPYFLNGFFNSAYFVQQLTGTQTASVNQITTGMLNNYDVIRPTKDEENEFAEFVKLIDKSKFVSHSKNFL